MKHLVILISFLLFASKVCFSQQSQKPQYTKYIFDPKANASSDVKFAMERAKAEKKNVFVFVGGDWDYWCRYFNDLFINDRDVSPVLKDYYVLVRINFSPLNKNEEVLAQLKCPKNEGYPIFMIFDTSGNNLCRQNTDEFKQYFGSPGDEQNKLINFLARWSQKYHR